MKLQFDFRNHIYAFCDPVQVIQTYEIDTVLECLQEVEAWTQRGYYAAGFISYEASSAFRPYLITKSVGKMPLLWFGIFKEPAPSIPSEFLNKDTNIDPALLKWFSDTSWNEYQTAIQTIKNHIAMGDSYQVNYTLRMEAEFPYDSYAFYQHLLKAQQSNYSAYLDNGKFQILSASPELFFEIQDRIITTRPMKGTASRGLTNMQDQQNKQVLDNEKNRAENLMIVDLLRNDLGQIARQGTVKVPSLYDKEKYPTVWQLTSEIKAELQEKVSLVDIFKALFPCGSITGAPKASTMKIIADLEKQPREIYCGALGLITPKQDVIFSVPIRTMVVHQQKAIYGVGGGITWDSTSYNEYEEVIHKIQVLYECKMPEQLLETLLLEDGIYFLCDLHLNRLKESAEYFNFLFNAAEIQKKLYQFASHYAQGRWKVRLLLDQKGNIQLEAVEIDFVESALTIRWADVPMKRHNVFLYHKTTRREFYPKVGLNHEVLLFNEDGEVTEFVNGNFLLYKEDQWITPPISSGLLSGTMRQSLLQQGLIKEAVIRKEDIITGCKMAFINSVRKWRNVRWQET